MAGTKQFTEENGLLKQFMDLLNQQNMGEQSQDFMELFKYAAGMQIQLAVMADELQGVREQLSQLQENQPKTVKENLMAKVEHLQEKITDLSERISAVKDHLLETATQAVNAFKEKGKSEMCRVVQKGISGIKSVLADYRERLVDVMMDYQKTANQIDSMNGIPAIGVNIHTPGTEAFEDVGIDILSGKRIDLDMLEYIPDIKGNPQAMEVIAELVAKLPEMEIDGHMSEEFEAKVWEKRMPDLTPAEQLAVEIDRFTYDYDTALYQDNSQSMTENVSELVEALKQGDTRDIAMWFADVVTEGTEPEETKRAMELLERLTEYKPLAKIEEMEEQNYNMVDNVLNNGAGEKAQKEENKKEQERPAARTSLKARLAEKKALVSGQGKDHEAQENKKNSQREM